MERNEFTNALAATTVGVYLVVTLGAAATTTAAGDITTTVARLVVLTHAAVAAVVGLALAALALLAWRVGTPRRVRVGTAVAALGYPIQAAAGVHVPVVGLRVVEAPGVHLAGGLAVFATALVTLVWQLDPAADADTVADAESTTATTQSAAPTAPAATGGMGDDTAGNDPPTTAPAVPLTDRVRAYLSLTKPRLMWLLCLLALAGMALATTTGAPLDGVTVVATLGGGVLAVGAAGTFNHVYERDRDRRMDRTADRPLAQGVVSTRGATAFGLTLAAASTALLVSLVNPLAAALTAAAIVYYAGVYTVVLKPTTAWNTVVGGGAGALPAVIGWTAVTGSLGVPGLLLAAVVCCWTPAHFYNLAIARRDDYARADYPMLPVVESVGLTRRRICYWLGATLVVASVLGVVVDFGPLYALTAALAGGGFLATVVRQVRVDTDRAAYRSFHASNAFLGAVLVAILWETLLV